jgi:hypothetical protein
MPRECPPAFRSARAAHGTDSSKRTSVPPPIAIDLTPVHFRIAAPCVLDPAPGETVHCVPVLLMNVQKLVREM